MNKMPLFPIIPTGCPKILAKPVTRVYPNIINRFCLSMQWHKKMISTRKNVAIKNISIDKH